MTQLFLGAGNFSIDSLIDGLLKVQPYRSS